MKLRVIIFSILFLILISGCQNSRSPQPYMSYPGYRVNHIAGFDPGNKKSTWNIEGNGQCLVLPDSSIQLTLPADSPGSMLWLKDQYKGDLQMEYEITFSDSSGMHVLYMCAEALKNSEMGPDSTLPYGTYKYYAQTMRSYQVAMHSYNKDFQHLPFCRMRKNPGQLLLSHMDKDPCRFSETYLIDFIKTGNRLQFFVDEARIHDVRDKGIFNPIFTEGRVGLWFEGTGVEYSIILRKVNLFKLSPY